MHHREHHEVMIVCDNCGREGRLEVDEGETPLHEQTRLIRAVTEGFTIRGSKIVCDQCGTFVPSA